MVSPIVITPFLPILPPAPTTAPLSKSGDGVAAGSKVESFLPPTASAGAPSPLNRFEASDYEAVSLIHNARFPELPLSAGEMRFVDDTRDPRCVLFRWTGGRANAPEGFAELTQSSETYHPTRYQFRICLRPEAEGHGLEGEFLKTVVETFRHRRGATLRTSIREDLAGTVSALEAYGFVPSMRFIDKTLDLANYDEAAVRRMAARVPEGVSVRTLRELRSDPDCHRKLFDLEKALRQDAPFPEDTTMRFDYFERAMLKHPGLLTDGYLVAVQEGRYVGVTALSRREGNRTAYVQLTGVLSSHRKKGIALHLKARAILHAREAGFESIFTSNEENNRGICDLNERLGFRGISSRLSWARTF